MGVVGIRLTNSAFMRSASPLCAVSLCIVTWIWLCSLFGRLGAKSATFRVSDLSSFVLIIGSADSCHCCSLHGTAARDLGTHSDYYYHRK